MVGYGCLSFNGDYGVRVFELTTAFVQGLKVPPSR